MLPDIAIQKGVLMCDTEYHLVVTNMTGNEIAMQHWYILRKVLLRSKATVAYVCVTRLLDVCHLSLGFLWPAVQQVQDLHCT